MKKKIIAILASLSAVGMLLGSACTGLRMPLIHSRVMIFACRGQGALTNSLTSCAITDVADLPHPFSQRKARNRSSFFQGN
jgi:hypothetical protein